MYDSAFGMLAIDPNHLNEYPGFVIFLFLAPSALSSNAHKISEQDQAYLPRNRSFRGVGIQASVSTVNT